MTDYLAAMAEATVATTMVIIGRSTTRHVMVAMATAMEIGLQSLVESPVQPATP
ncbi:hypothetical protein [Curvibacter sp. AEP1-3]|uniref:hypothetical protein n=1 Tax=Curvibacter sp. AEP1-3 TaxID=1844971 RepID=UPI001E410270|nr:hypothetical protein [Curvibacter sp. AEP1-3]